MSSSTWQKDKVVTAIQRLIRSHQEDQITPDVTLFYQNQIQVRS